ncbi:MAG: ornithine carbamoyltransferase [Euryarchaeota archaeon]|nr:ornithine carbamoyltransferase [Euryarchaeota archaeon]
MHILSFTDFEGMVEELFELAERLKAGGAKGDELRNRSLAMIFEKASTRTRVSFEVAMTQLGGHAIYLSPREMQMGRGESIADTARTLSRYVDAVLIRARRHEDVEEFARHAEVPVINGLTELEHPCQALSDFFTMRELRGELSGLKLAYVGDGNNVCHSLMLGSAMLGMRFSCASPEGYEPRQEVVRKALELAERSGASIEVLHSPEQAVEGADFVYTDVWVSMGQEDEEQERLRRFRSFQLNSELLRHAPEAKVMHCLPAKRGLEITDEVMDGSASVVWQQAENRLHVQKAILLKLLA